jgi:hypothetical protein
MNGSSGQPSVKQRSGAVQASIIHECPYGSPHTKHEGINNRCSRVEPLRQPAASTNTGRSALVLTTSGHRR